MKQNLHEFLSSKDFQEICRRMYVKHLNPEGKKELYYTYLDLAQEVSCKVWLKIDDIRPKNGSYHPIIYRIAENTAIDFLRKKSSSDAREEKRHRLNYDLRRYFGLLNVISRLIEKGQIKLTPAQIQLWNCIDEGLSTADTAAKLNTEPGNISTRKNTLYKRIGKSITREQLLELVEEHDDTLYIE